MSLPGCCSCCSIHAAAVVFVTVLEIYVAVAVVAAVVHAAALLSSVDAPPVRQHVKSNMETSNYFKCTNKNAKHQRVTRCTQL